MIICHYFFQFLNRPMCLHANARLGPAEPISGLGNITLFEVPQSQDQPITRRQLRQKPMNQFSRFSAVHCVVLRLNKLVPLFIGYRNGLRAFMAIPEPIAHTCCDASQPVFKRCFSGIAVQAHIGLDEYLLYQFFVVVSVSRKTPQQFADRGLMAFNQTSIGFGVAVSGVPNVLRIGRARRFSVAVMPQAEQSQRRRAAEVPDLLNCRSELKRFCKHAFSVRRSR